jgi:hypothetical protein
VFTMFVTTFAIFPVPSSVGNKTTTGGNQTNALVNNRIFFTPRC